MTSDVAPILASIVAVLVLVLIAAIVVLGFIAALPCRPRSRIIAATATAAATVAASALVTAAAPAALDTATDLAEKFGKALVWFERGATAGMRVGAVQHGMAKLDGQDRGNGGGPGAST